MRQAAAFVEALVAARAYLVEDGRLVLVAGDGARLATFAPEPGTALRGTAWRATMVNNGAGAVVSLALGTAITATFGADGTLSGTAGCSPFTTTYATDGDRMTIAPPVSARKACTGAVMEQERRFLGALERVAAYRLGERRLELRDAAGALQVSLTLAP
jgi:heat shock protein HslJ